MYTLSDDIALYARGFFNRYRGMAYPMTIDKARQSSEYGDKDSEKLWLSVAASIKEIAEEQPRAD